MAISTVSFMKTPQAGDDTFATNEDSSLVMDLDVMANDLGGNAKKLYSVDNGDRPTDLLAKDATGAAELSALGAWISIVNGKVHYDASALSGQLQSLQEGEVFEDKFTYAIQMANGTLSWATAVVRICGRNDAASMSGDQSGSVTEDGPVSAAGTLTVVDADHDQSHTKAADADSALGHYTVDADGHWNYTVDNDAIQHLAEGAQVTDSFVVTSLDGTASTTVTITITGVNDVATIDGSAAGSGSEDSTDAITGSLGVSDVDDGEAHAQAASGSSAKGSWSVDADGNWSYTIDNAAAQHLGAGAEDTDTFVVTSLDGTASTTVTITITGENDAASISGDAAGSGSEDSTEAVTGALSVSDVDDGEAQAQADSGSSAKGSWSVDADGSWSYTIDNDAAQHLAAGAEDTDTFTVTSADGTASQLVTVTIHGENDAASISGDTDGAVTEAGSGNGGGAPGASGDVSVSDVDDGQSAAEAASGAGANGYGTYTVDADGHWTYTLDNDNDAVNALNDGDHLSDSFVVASLDGSAAVTVTIDIVGASDSVPPPPPATSGDPNNFDDKTGSDRGTPNPDTLVGSAGGDNITGNNGGDVIYGTEGDDTLQGNNQGDTLYGGSGDDVLNGNNENDVIYGGDGEDTLIGENNNDTLVGGYGDDSMQGNAGNDVFKYLSTDDRTDTISGWNAGDKIDIQTLLASSPATTWSLESDGAGGTNLMIDVDGAGLYTPVALVDVLGVTLTASDILA